MSTLARKWIARAAYAYAGAGFSSGVMWGAGTYQPSRSSVFYEHWSDEVLLHAIKWPTRGLLSTAVCMDSEVREKIQDSNRVLEQSRVALDEARRRLKEAQQNEA